MVRREVSHEGGKAINLLALRQKNKYDRNIFDGLLPQVSNTIRSGIRTWGDPSPR